MTRWVIVTLIVAGIVSMAGAQESQQYVRVKSENFRSSPGGKIMGRLNGGTKLKVVSEEGQWVKVQVEGYVWKPSVTSDSSEVEGFQIRAMHILTKTQAEAQQLLDKLNQGTDLGQLAVEYSIDPGARNNKGDLGYFSRGDLIKEFEDVAFRLAVGETSGIVKTSLGFHIIRRVE